MHKKEDNRAYIDGANLSIKAKLVFSKNEKAPGADASAQGPSSG